MKQSLRFALVVAVVLVVGGSLDAFDAGAASESASCVHEMVYESFAGLVMVSVTVGDSPPLDFVVDSGATSSSITDPVLAWAVGLEVKETGLARGVGSGATRVAVAEDICLRMDGVEVLRTPLVVHDIGDRLAEVAGREIHGFLGADFFETYVVEIDPVGRRLLLHDPETFVYRGSGDEIPLAVVDRRPVVRGSVVVKDGGKEVPVNLVADTGSGRFLSLIKRSRRHLKPPTQQRSSKSIGVVGNSTVIVTPIRQLQLGSIIARNVEAAWLDAFGVPAVRNIDHLNGIVGNQFLSHFHVFFDYRGGRLILEPVQRDER